MCSSLETDEWVFRVCHEPFGRVLVRQKHYYHYITYRTCGRTSSIFRHVMLKAVSVFGPSENLGLDMPVRMAALPQLVPEAVALADSPRIPHQSTILPPRHLEIIFRLIEGVPNHYDAGEG